MSFTTRVLMLCPVEHRAAACIDAAYLSGNPGDAVPEFFSIPCMREGASETTHYGAVTAAREEVALSTSWASFAIIAAGAIGCVVGGRRALRVGSARVAMIQVVASGALALTAPLWSTLPTPLFLALLFAWGVVVVGDSPQFSTLNALTAPRELVGSGLTIVTSIGFGVTIFSIELVSQLARVFDILWVLPVMAIGPALSVLAIRSLVADDPSRSAS